MKNSKSPIAAAESPTQKKLKQARLPFSLISDVSPNAKTPQTRKRKLSEPESESVTKVPKPDSAKKNEEKEKERQEKEKERELKKQLEKEEKAKQRQDKEEQRKKEREEEKAKLRLEREEQRKREKEEKEEAKRREREEKEEQKKKEREEKEKQKELERKEKEEQKRKEKEDKEEQKRKEREAREEEKRKKQEALELEKQEQEHKKRKAAEAFVNFFVPKQKVEKIHTVFPVSKSSLLSSFTVKADMRLAPIIRLDLPVEKKEALDKIMEKQNVKESNLYLKILKNGSMKPQSSGKTWPLCDSDKDDDVMIIEDELPPMDGAGEITSCDQTPCEKLRPKLLSFQENRRPPYWGTWRKKSATVKARNPFKQDQKYLDYEVDSDDDWEEEQEGESLDGSACGSDEEPDAKDDYEVDNELFVPHGYLSDEEATMDEDDVMSLSPETQKARLKHLEDEFESELKKPTEKLKPRMYGLVWETEEGGKPDNCVDALWNYFQKYSMILSDTTPLLQPAEVPEETDKKKASKKKKNQTEGQEQSPKSEKKKKRKSENKETNKLKPEPRKSLPNQPGINTFLTKIKTS